MKSKGKLRDDGHFSRQLPEHLGLKLLFCFVSLAVLCTWAIAQEETAESWLKEGLILSDNGSYERALQAYDRSIEVDPKNKNAWINKANVLLQMNRTDEANAAYYKALEITDEMLKADSKNATLWSTKGLLLHNIGDYEEAVVAFDNANSVDPDYEMAWKMKAVILASELGRSDEAIEAFDRALEINPEDPRTWQAKSDALQSLGRKAEAEEAYANAQSLGYSIEPHTPQAPTVVVNVTSLGDDDFIELANDGSLSQEFNNLILIVDGDENNSIALPDLTMQPGQKMRIHLGQGESNQTDLYLWSKIDLNDAAGNLTLKDSISGIGRGYIEYWTPLIQENTTEDSD